MALKQRMALSPVGDITITKDGNVANVEWECQMLPPNSDGTLIRSTDKSAKQSLVWSRGMAG